MGNNRNLTMGLLAVGLCVGLSWGVSPSMAASTYQTQNQKKTNMLRSFKTPVMKRYVKPATKTNVVAPKLNKSLMANPFNTKNSTVTTKNLQTLSPGYRKNVVSAVDNTSKFNHTDAAAKGQANINIGKPVLMNPDLPPPQAYAAWGWTQPNVPKAIQAEQAAAAKKQAAAQAGSGGWGGGYGKAPTDPNFGGYGGNGGNGVLPPGPERVPGSTAPPSAQSNQSQSGNMQNLCAQLNLPILCH